MRIVVVFLVAAGVWLAINGFGDERRSHGGIASYFGFDEVDEDAPNWGDVADRIGVLASERDMLREGLSEQASEAAQ